MRKRRRLLRPFELNLLQVQPKLPRRTRKALCPSEPDLLRAQRQVFLGIGQILWPIHSPLQSLLIKRAIPPRRKRPLPRSSEPGHLQRQQQTPLRRRQILLRPTRFHQHHRYLHLWIPKPMMVLHRRNHRVPSVRQHRILSVLLRKQATDRK